jgi:hypothetical protein
MIRASIAGSQSRIGAVLICAIGVTFAPAAHASGPAIASKLERAGVIDNYFPEVVVEVGADAGGAWPVAGGSGQPGVPEPAGSTST